MLIRAETAAPVTEDTWKEELQGSRGQKGRKSKEKRDRGVGEEGRKKGRDGLVREKVKTWAL